MKNIVLTGMMGCGKSTCGRLIARMRDMELVDMDEYIVKKDGRAVSEIFTQDGEAFFRDLETACARELGARRGIVIACGGGVVLRQENMDALRENGVVFFLNRPVDQIFDRVDLRDRPLAQDGKAAFLKTFAQREALYRGTADFVVEQFATPRETAALICRLLEEKT